MLEAVHCDGAPRDLGLDQGRACRDAIRADARALGFAPTGSGLRALAARRAGGSPPARRDLGPLLRDLARHFPHLAERTTGIAAGAGLTDQALVALLAHELLDPGDGAVEAIAFGAAEPPVLALRFREPLAPTGLVVRAVTPDGGYPNLTLARVGLGAALAGVNERGLAAAALQIAPPEPGERCLAPAALLAEGCLERLDAVEKALEWCERRPAGGRARLLFADARGARGGIEIDGERRRRLGLGELTEPLRVAGSGARIEPAARALRIERVGGSGERFALPPRAEGGSRRMGG